MILRAAPLILWMVVPVGAPLADEAGAAAADAEIEREAYDIGRYLRCPVCQGMPIAESPATMAQDMMKRVREMLAEGKSRPEIFAYFEQRYGQWALLEPKAEGLNWIVWLAPPCGLVLGLWLTWRWAVVSHRPAASGSPRADVRQETSRSKEEAAGAEGDPYLRRVREELER